jgi:hypothetical protein
MEIFVTGQYQLSDLENLQEIQPLQYAKKTILKRLDYLIGFIMKVKTEILVEFVSKLNNKYIKLLNRNPITEEIASKEYLNEEFINLKDYPDLVNNCLCYYLQLLGIETEENWMNDIFKIQNQNYIRSFLHQRYYNALALTEIMERGEAVQLFKDYIDSFVKSISSNWRKYESLEEFREARKPKKDDPPSIGWVIVQGKIKNGKFPQKKTTCMWADAINELPDTELRYLAACYGDFQGYNNSNENFILTMKRTIVEGFPYCDCVTHDMRISNDLKHPSKEFFDSMWQ